MDDCGAFCAGQSFLSVPLDTVGAMTTANYTAAWVPDDDETRPWDDAAELAAEWILREAAQQGARPVLVTPTQSQWDCGVKIITRFAQQYAALTPRSKGFAKGPTLAYVPDYEGMELAANVARSSSLAVVETVSYPLLGWAMEVGALNLLTNEPTPDTRTDSQRKLLDRIHFYGNNGWTTGFGKNQTTRILQDTNAEGMACDVILGSMVAKGHGKKAIERLGVIVDKLA